MAVKGNNLTPRCREAEVAEKVRLGDVCTPLKGEQINGSELSDKFGYPFLNGGVEPSGKWRDYNVSGGTVTVSEGGNSCGFVNYMEDDFWCGAHCYYLSNPRCDSKYLFHSLKAKQKEIQALRTGVCMPNIKKSVISNFAIKYHCEVEIQRRIAAELDKICELKKNAETRLEKLDLLVKSRFVEMFGDPMTNPKRWPMGSVSDIAKYWNGLTYKPEDVSEQGTIVLRSSNIQNGSLDFADIVRVNLDAKEKNQVAPGDILMCSRNGSAALVGKTAIIPKLSEKMYFGAFMMVLRCGEPAFLNAYFTTKAFRAQIVCGKTSTVNQITCSMMDKVRLPVPPLALQREFAAFVKKVDKLKDVAKKLVEQMDTLYRARLQEYFG